MVEIKKKILLKQLIKVLFCPETRELIGRVQRILFAIEKHYHKENNRKKVSNCQTLRIAIKFYSNDETLS